MRWLSMPPKIILKKGLKKLSRELRSCGKRLSDLYQPAYASNFPPNGSRLATYLNGLSVGPDDSEINKLLAVTDYYCRHYFDLLGSGWVQVKHNMDCLGLEGIRYHIGVSPPGDRPDRWLKERITRPNCNESMRIWRLIDTDYVPLDWQLDFKSGYRWSEKTYYLDIRYGHIPGVDIKVPWELARMQHLPQLALAYTAKVKVKCAGNSTDTYPGEFRNQILDFIATNPPGFGVNWHCTMDVGIRVANWLVAYDIFKSGGVAFDSSFERIFIRSIYEHGRHIINNLEWSPELRTNHYLADIVGLLFVAAYLPESTEINGWFHFAIKELIAEVKLQFGEDGGNFEASTSYHRLSAEMAVYATALVLGIPEARLKSPVDVHYFQKKRVPFQTGPIHCHPLPGGGRSPFPSWYMERLEKSAEFTMHITKPDGHIPQIGDNDSGRFFKLQTEYRPMDTADALNMYANLKGYMVLAGTETYWSEDILDHRHIIAAINCLYGRPDFAEFAGEETLETGVIRRFSQSIRFPSFREPGTAAATQPILDDTDQKLIEIMADWEHSYVNYSTKMIPLPAGCLDGELKVHAYPDFGLYIYRTERLYLAVRCGSTGQNGNGGHAHNDQLAIELHIDGEDLICDPGTYLYTPLPERRNLFRSVKSHYTPWCDNREPGRLDFGLFTMGEAEGGQVIWFGKQGFWGKYKDVQLLLVIQTNQMILKARSTARKVGWNDSPSLPFSDGYGRLRG
jgi:hypothetical protein